MSCSPPPPPYLWEIIDKIVPVARQFDEAIRPHKKAIHTWFAKHGPTIMCIAINIARLPDNIRESLLSLAKEGWYPDPEMCLNDILKLGKETITCEKNTAEKWLVCYFSDRLDIIEEKLCYKHCNRSDLIHSAFAAHRRGEFCLSIPVLLAQADGICDELTPRLSPFRRRQKQPQIAAYVRDFADDWYLNALLRPLAEPLPLTASHSERAAHDQDSLNRHSIMHGESTDYGTEANGLKAISFLNYVSIALGSVDKEMLGGSGGFRGHDT